LGSTWKPPPASCGLAPAEDSLGLAAKPNAVYHNHRNIAILKEAGSQFLESLKNALKIYTRGGREILEAPEVCSRTLRLYGADSENWGASLDFAGWIWAKFIL
jgi:hypothetical protein